MNATAVAVDLAESGFNLPWTLQMPENEKQSYPQSQNIGQFLAPVGESKYDMLGVCV